MGSSPACSSCLSSSHISPGAETAGFPSLSWVTEIFLNIICSSSFPRCHLPWDLLRGQKQVMNLRREADLPLKKGKLRGISKLLYCSFINIYKHYITSYFSYASQWLNKICNQWNYLQFKVFITTPKHQNRFFEGRGGESFFLGGLPSEVLLWLKKPSL